MDSKEYELHAAAVKGTLHPHLLEQHSITQAYDYRTQQTRPTTELSEDDIDYEHWEAHGAPHPDD